MTREEIDQLYHLLRKVSNIAGEIDTTTGLTPAEEISVYEGLCRHLLSGGDYLALVRFSSYYGTKFLVEPTYEATKKTGWEFSRIVEFGSGLGWLGRGLSARLGLLPCMFIDKRPWTLTDVVADLETEKGREQVLGEMRDGDLIVMCDFLHCLDNPEEVLEPFSKWPMVVLEYMPTNPGHRKSYFTQISRYGATPFHPEGVTGVFEALPGRSVDAVDLDPYLLFLVK